MLVLGAGAYWDCRERRIPNRIVLVTMALATGERVMTSGLMAGLLSAGVAWLVGVFPWAILWARGWMGAGDAKYFAAGAMLLPIPVIWQATALAALLGGVLAGTLLLARRGTYLRTSGPSSHASGAAPAGHAMPTLPYALPMGVALTVVRWWSHGSA